MGFFDWFKKKDEKKDSNEEIAKLREEIELLQGKLQDAERKSVVSEESETKIDELKVKYEALLKEATDQTKMLDQQLKNALEGKLDDSIKGQIAEVDLLKKKICGLEAELKAAEEDGKKKLSAIATLQDNLGKEKDASKSVSDELSSIKKSLKEKEEELEEMEDDLSDAKKKLRSKDDEIASLQDNLGKEKRAAMEISTELTSVKATLQEKMEELSLKMGSLDFVQEILSAPETNRSDIKKIEDNITEMKSFALGQLMDCYATLKDGYITFGEGDFDSFKKYWQQRFNEWASVTKKSWINGKTTIAFVGEFSAGKTSIVNRILSQDDPNVPQLPVSTKATTAIATYIAGGPAVSYQFVTPDDKLKSISQKTFTEKVSKEVLDQVKGISSLVQYFVMTYKNPNLNGLSILDTPGFNSNDKNDAERTMEVINECDALFWVFDVNAGTVNRSSIKIIKENLNKPLYVVINKVDTKSASDVQKVEDLIRKTLNDEGLKVEQFIRFSAKALLSDIMTPIKNVKHLAEKEQYLSDLNDGINSVLGILDSQVKEADKEYREAEANGQKVDDKFVKQMKTLYGHCNTAAGIPHYEEHLLRKDNYEMSQAEYSRLCNVLDQSCSGVERMGSIYDEKTNSAFTMQQTWSAVCEVKAAWQRVNDIKNQFLKIQKKF